MHSKVLKRFFKAFHLTVNCCFLLSRAGDFWQDCAEKRTYVPKERDTIIQARKTIDGKLKAEIKKMFQDKTSATDGSTWTVPEITSLRPNEKEKKGGGENLNMAEYYFVILSWLSASPLPSFSPSTPRERISPQAETQRRMVSIQRLGAKRNSLDFFFFISSARLLTVSLSLSYQMSQ